MRATAGNFKKHMSYVEVEMGKSRIAEGQTDKGTATPGRLRKKND